MTPDVAGGSRATSRDGREFRRTLVCLVIFMHRRLRCRRAIDAVHGLVDLHGSNVGRPRQTRFDVASDVTNIEHDNHAIPLDHRRGMHPRPHARSRRSTIAAGGSRARTAFPVDRRLSDATKQAGAAFWWKQWGGIRPHSAGRALNGRMRDEFPADVTGAMPDPASQVPAPARRRGQLPIVTA